MKRSILYVDPDEAARERFRAVIERTERLSVTTTGVLDEALERLEETPFDVVVCDPAIGEDRMSELFSRARKQERPVPCIIFTDKDIDELLDDEILLGASAFTSKQEEDAFTILVDELKESLRPRSELDYPVPEDEDARLKAANELDLQRLREEDAFDRLTKLAGAFFDVRYAFVGIVREDTEQFISFEGSDVADLKRECSICTFGILDDEATVIDNRQKDERFKYIDELDDLDIVFYAGYPLITKEGFRIGMFCLMDDEPRTFTAEDRRYLKLFAEEATELIRLYGEDT